MPAPIENRLADPVRHRRIDVQRRDLVVQRLEAADPVIVVHQLETERCIDADSEREVVAGRQHEVRGRYEIPVARVAAVAAERLREGWRGAVVANSEPIRCRLRSRRPRVRAVPSFPAGLKNTVVASSAAARGAREGRAQPARTLFEQRESGRACDRRYQRQGSSRRHEPAVLVVILHRILRCLRLTIVSAWLFHCACSSHSAHTPRGCRKTVSFSRNCSRAVATTSRAPISRAGASAMNPRC